MTAPKVNDPAVLTRLAALWAPALACVAAQQKAGRAGTRPATADRPESTAVRQGDTADVPRPRRRAA